MRPCDSGLMSTRRSPLGWVLGVMAVALLTHSREGNADCAYTPEVFRLELERVTANGQVVADRSAWQRNTLEVESHYPGQASLSISADGDLGINVTMSPAP